jgi:CrcB protein
MQTKEPSHPHHVLSPNAYLKRRNNGVDMARHHTLAFLLIFLGGGIGSMLRHAVNQTSAALFGVNFPWGTLLVNIIGSLAMGLLAGWFAFRGEGGQLLRLFLATGILGGFTTFSAFSLDAALLWESGRAVTAGIYAVGSVAAAILGVFAGIAIMRSLLA